MYFIWSTQFSDKVLRWTFDIKSLANTRKEHKYVQYKCPKCELVNGSFNDMVDLELECQSLYFNLDGASMTNVDHLTKGASMESC
jgi:phage FluMu protein Com